MNRNENTNENVETGDEGESNADSGEWLVREFAAGQEDVRAFSPESNPEPSIAVGIIRTPSGKQMDGGDVNIESVLPAVRWSPSLIVPTELSSADLQHPNQAQTPTNGYTVTAVPALYSVSLDNDMPYKKSESGVTIACTFCNFKGEGKLQRYKIGLAIVTILLIASIALIIFAGPFHMFGSNDLPLDCNDVCYDETDYMCGCSCYDDDTECIYQIDKFKEIVCEPYCYDESQGNSCECLCYPDAETDYIECISDDEGDDEDNNDGEEGDDQNSNDGEEEDDQNSNDGEEGDDKMIDPNPLSCPSFCYEEGTEKRCDCACYSEIELMNRDCDSNDDNEDEAPRELCHPSCYVDSATSCRCTCYQSTYEGECIHKSSFDDDLQDDEYDDDDYYYDNDSIDDDDNGLDDNFDDKENQACHDACYDDSGTVCDCTCYVYSSYDGRACNDDDSADYYFGNMEDTPCMNFCYRLPEGNLPERWSPGRCPDRCYRHQKQFVKRYNKWAEDILPELRNTPMPTSGPKVPTPAPKPPTPRPTSKKTKSKKGGRMNIFQGN